jgi:hypothetical protein
VKHILRTIPHFRFLVRGFILLIAVSVGAQPGSVSGHSVIGDGWHPWYEVKADPENPKNLIVCGTKWDPHINGPFGFVYASADEGATWHSVLEDRNSAWVTEQSCAYGAKHRAYFISEASKVIDGRPNPSGMTRLFVSTDSGWHWAERIKTGWADYSTSAVSRSSGEVYTLFNSGNPSRKEGNRIRGSSVGLLVFSGDGNKVAGPFYDSSMRGLGYQGVFPSNGVSLRNGSIVALYYGKRRTPSGWEADLGVIRAIPSTGRKRPVLEPTVISHPVMDWEKGCFNYSDNSLAYSPETNRIFVVYVDGCSDTKRLLLTSSRDEGRTWTKCAVVSYPRHLSQHPYSPSLVANANAQLGLLWGDGDLRRSGRWFFSWIRKFALAESLTELSGGADENEVNNDSLRVGIDQANAGSSNAIEDSSAITVTVLSELNTVWRGKGLVAMGNQALAVWPSSDKAGTHLYSSSWSVATPRSNPKDATDHNSSTGPDVTRQVAILYGGDQHFDANSRTLDVCLAVLNRGTNSMTLPLRIEARDMRSPIGTVQVLNAANSLEDQGAWWDVIGSDTGHRLTPGATSKPFCLAFHLDSAAQAVSSSEADELLILKLKVLEAAPDESE